MLISAYPLFRSKLHNTFEYIHRFAGWTALALLWSQIMLLTKDFVAPNQKFSSLLVKTPAFWFLIIITISIASSWFHLKKVKVTSKRLSEHAIQFYLDYTDRPVPGSFSRLSDKPLFEWHSFATIADPERDGFSMIISRAGDWSGKYIDNPPTEMWVRSIPGKFHVHTFVQYFHD